MARKHYAEEYREQIVKLVLAGRSIASLAREFEPTEPTIRAWVAVANSTEALKEVEFRRDFRRMKRKLARVEQENAILAKATAWFAGETMKTSQPIFEFIKAHQTEFRISTMCRVLPVSHSGYYAWLSRGPSRWEEADRQLLPLIQRIFEDSGGHYGAPRIQAVLREQEMRVSKTRIARLMSAAGMRGDSRRS